MSKIIKESVLFRTSAGTDVQCSGGVISVAGLKSVSKNDITGIFQNKYKAEVAQVVTVTTAATPAASTPYKIVVYDPTRYSQSYTESARTYKFKTPATITDLGGSAALQREAINAALIAAINADTENNHATAVTLGSGTGFTVTDAGGYYPVFSQSMTNIKGVNDVYTVMNEDGSGFIGTEAAVSTAAVYSFGVGANLLAQKPITSFVFNNLISGILDAPPVTVTGLPAVSGQNYDAFTIVSLKAVPAVGISGQLAYQDRIQTIYVDNGTGSTTTNLTGFKAFERAMLALIFDQYANDPSTIYTLGNTAAVSQGLGTGLPSGTSLAENVVAFGNGFATHYFPLGTNTILAPTSSNDGLLLQLDVTAGEGIELSAPTWADSLKNFVVGKTAASIYCKIKVTDVTGVNPLWVGFRKQAAANTTYTSYTDYAFVGLGSATGDLYTSTEKNGAGNTNTDTTQNWANTETHTLEVRVDISGACTFFIDGIKPTVTQSFTFDSDDVLIPVFGYVLQAGSGSAVNMLEGAFLPTDAWRN